MAHWLTSQGHEAYHVNDLGMTSTEDRIIWRHAREISACIVTKDEDFTILQALDPTGPTVVWIRIGNAVRSALLRRLPGIWPSVVSAIERGNKVIEVK